MEIDETHWRINEIGWKIIYENIKLSTNKIDNFKLEIGNKLEYERIIAENIYNKIPHKWYFKAGPTPKSQVNFLPWARPLRSFIT